MGYNVLYLYLQVITRLQRVQTVYKSDFTLYVSNYMCTFCCDYQFRVKLMTTPIHLCRQRSCF